MADGAGGDAGAVGGDANVIAAMGLGWHMAEIHDVVPVPVGPDQPPPDGPLGGLGDLSSYSRQLLGLDQVDFALATLETAGTWPDPVKVVLPDTGAARAALQAIHDGTASGPVTPAAYRDALRVLHVDLLIVLQAANPGWGSAYRLGRRLADTVRVMGDNGLYAAFADDQIGHLVALTGDLATLLPPHAGKAVATSIGWWHTEVSQAFGPAPTPDAPPVVVDSDAPPRRRRALRDHQRDHRMASVVGRARRRPVQVPHGVVAPLGLADLEKALPRQGEVWRSVLSGEKAATDMLQPDDYIQAARSFIVRGARLARQAPLTAWLALVGIAIAAFVALLVIGFVVSGSAATGAGVFGGIVAAIVAGWGVVKGRALGALEKLEAPLWGAELDRAIADAVTLPPVGGDPQDPWTPLAIAHAHKADTDLQTAYRGIAHTPKVSPASEPPPRRPPRTRRPPE
ncbi:MAG TPA: hypothetical protein VG184_10415 [Acidimicrobiales bacterium]|jgi:hypothetical protein|nr:hypothetical protein [Acidimicrobiales bacterium]